MSEKKVWDIVVVGAGPSGMTVGIYAARAKREVLILERFAPGGLLNLTDLIENYPGFSEPIKGHELATAMESQAKKLGAKFELANVEKIELADDLKIVYSDSKVYHAKTLVIASGTSPKRLNVPGELKYIGHGVSTCAVCDGPFFKGQIVGVVGGGDSAVQEAIYLARLAKEVHLIHRRDQLRATKILQEKACATPNIKFHWNRVVVSIDGNERLKSVILRDTTTGETERLELDGLFIYIGLVPNTDFLTGLPIATNDAGFILTNEKMETSVPSIYAVGDVRAKQLRQISTAVGDGATAAFDLEKYLG